MINVAIIGCGARGQSYAQYMKKNEAEMKIVAIAEPKPFLREKMIKEYNVPAENVFSDYEELLSKGVIADALFVCTQDNEHVKPVVDAIETGYKFIMVEKPIDKRDEQNTLLAKKAKEYGAVVQVCHSLRYTKYYRKLKEILDGGVIGDIVHIDHLEAVDHFHYAHSFVRGDWNNSDRSSHMILAKCCHDTDLLVYLTDKKCKKVSSFGSLKHFKKENAPEGSTERCIDGCPLNHKCPYSAMKYFDKYRNHLFREYAVEKEGFETIEEAMKQGRYGRCVYRCDNNVVDHQVASFLFEDDVTASLTMCAFTDIGRITRIYGTMGEIYAQFDKDKIEVCEFTTGDTVTYEVSHDDSLHGGADINLVRDFLQVVRGEKQPATSIDISLESHRMCNAAEKSRLNGGTSIEVL